MSPAVRSKWRTWNHGCAILTPRSLASLLRAMQAPSLLESTTTGRPTSASWNTRSHETYMLFASTSASIGSRGQAEWRRWCRCLFGRGSGQERLDDGRDDAPDLQLRAIP